MSCEYVLRRSVTAMLFWSAVSSYTSIVTYFHLTISSVIGSNRYWTSGYTTWARRNSSFWWTAASANTLLVMFLCFNTICFAVWCSCLQLRQISRTNQPRRRLGRSSWPRRPCQPDSSKMKTHCYCYVGVSVLVFIGRFIVCMVYVSLVPIYMIKHYDTRRITPHEKTSQHIPSHEEEPSPYHQAPRQHKHDHQHAVDNVITTTYGRHFTGGRPHAIAFSHPARGCVYIYIYI